MKTEPFVFLENEEWALLVKPHDLPSAPLAENDSETLLGWYLEKKESARDVIGRKAIEHGLIHRLDTGTSGFVLVAKTQKSYEKLITSQKDGCIKKTYLATCSLPQTAEFSSLENLPMHVTSRFRAFGPGRREVRPLFPGMRGYIDAATDYETIIEKIMLSENNSCKITCSLARGYRHQVRAHLAYLGFPIFGDRLYNPLWKNTEENAQDIPLQLFARGISFPDPETGLQVSFSLPQQDKMNR